MSDHLWEKHMNQKWGRIIGPAAHREWQWHIATRKDSCFNQATPKGSFNYLSQLWPLSLVRSSLKNRITKRKNSPPVDSVMSWYLALESGKLFPAQVYNREVLIFLQIQDFHDNFYSILCGFCTIPDSS